MRKYEVLKDSSLEGVIKTVGEVVQLDDSLAKLWMSRKLARPYIEPEMVEKPKEEPERSRKDTRSPKRRK